MTALVLEGKSVAHKIRVDLAFSISKFRKQFGVAPTLAVVRVGNPPAAVSYALSIDRAFSDCEMGFQMHVLPEETTDEQLMMRLDGLSRAEDVHGILLQRPLPPSLNVRAVMSSFPVLKDVEGVTPMNLGNLASDGGDLFIPSTPAAAIEILSHYAIPIEGKTAVVVGRSTILGRPLALLLLRENATVVICHSHTRDLASLTRQADILFAAVGRSGFITSEMVAPGAAVIDFGVNVLGDRLVGDTDYQAVSQIAGAITPVPGGTGPVTTMMLMRNTLAAAEKLAAQTSSRGRIKWLPMLKPPRPRK